MDDDAPSQGAGRNLWRERQSALADFGRHALRSLDLDAILQEACVLVVRGLDVPIAKVLQVLPDEDMLLVRAAVGLPEELVVAGKTKVPAHDGSAAGHALKTGQPVISDVLTETRFEISEIVRKAGVRTSANVLIHGDGEAFGALEVDSVEARTFTRDDLDFLRTYAHLLSAAVERQRSGALVRKLARERETLLRELQHRVKNDLQIITALLTLELRDAETREVRSRLEGVCARIDSLRLVHDQLFATQRVGRVDLADYLRRLCEGRLRLHGGAVTLGLDLADTAQDHDRAVSIGLIVNEFLTNSLKHAFPSGQGTIRVALDASAPERLRLTLADDGIGRGQPRCEGRAGMGERLIELFTRDLEAEAEWSGDPGTRLTLTIPCVARRESG